MSPHVIIADPDPASRVGVARALGAAGYRVTETGDGMHALREVFDRQPGAVVMELNLPLLGGLELVRVLRAASEVVIVVLAENVTPAMAARVLDNGADHVMARPMHAGELVARLRSTLRRATFSTAASPVPGQDVVRTGPLAIDREARTVARLGVVVPMTRTEHLLLDALAGRVGQLCPHHYLLSTVWGSEYVDDTHYLRGYIASLRQKLEEDPANPRLLLTEWGTGYRLAALPVEETGWGTGTPTDGDVADPVADAIAS